MHLGPHTWHGSWNMLLSACVFSLCRLASLAFAPWSWHVRAHRSLPPFLIWVGVSQIIIIIPCGSQHFWKLPCVFFNFWKSGCTHKMMKMSCSKCKQGSVDMVSLFLKHLLFLLFVTPEATGQRCSPLRFSSHSTAASHCLGHKLSALSQPVRFTNFGDLVLPFVLSWLCLASRQIEPQRDQVSKQEIKWFISMLISQPPWHLHKHGPKILFNYHLCDKLVK